MHGEEDLNFEGCRACKSQMYHKPFSAGDSRRRSDNVRLHLEFFGAVPPLYMSRAWPDATTSDCDIMLSLRRLLCAKPVSVHIMKAIDSFDLLPDSWASIAQKQDSADNDWV